MQHAQSTLLELAQKRHSVRNYEPRQVEDDKLQYILEVARMAPSAVNYQPWKLYVVRDAVTLAALHKVYHREWFATAPCCIVVCGNHLESWHRGSDGKDHCNIDVGIVTQHLALAAAEQGLGSCWVCNFDVEACAELLQLPDGVEPMVLLPIGYAAEGGKHEKSRKSLDEIVKWI